MGIICNHEQPQPNPEWIQISRQPPHKNRPHDKKAELNPQQKSYEGRKPKLSFAKPIQKHYPLSQEAQNAFKEIINEQFLSPFEDETIYQIIGKGVSYQGQFQNHLPDGYGICYFEKGQMYLGNFRKGMMQSERGYYICYDGSYYIGRFRNSDFEGYGILVYGNRALEYSGQWKKGVPQGYGLEKYLNGSTFQGMFRNGKWQGYGRYQWETNVIYTGDFLQGELSGYGYLHNKDGELTFMGNFKKNKKNGKGTLKTGKGIYEGEFIDDELNGLGIFIWNDMAKVYIGNFKENKMNGEGRMIYGTGQEIYGQWFDNHKYKIQKQINNDEAELELKEIVERLQKKFQVQKEESSRIDDQFEEMSRKKRQIFQKELSSKRTSAP